MSVPIMQPPPPVDFVEMDRIIQLYRELPTHFAKLAARRQQVASGIINGNAKRERPDELGHDGIHKRRDTGETKVQVPGSFASPGAGPSTPHPPSQPMQQVPNVVGNVGMAAGAGIRMDSPSMPPPPVPPSAMGATPEAQMAAARRQAQLRQAMAAQQHPDGGRQMSPPSSMGPGGMSSGMSMANMPNAVDPSAMSNMQQMNANPNMNQFYQILNTPNHPFLQFLITQIPGFLQLPLQEKLQRMQMAQVSLIFELYTLWRGCNVRGRPRSVNGNLRTRVRVREEWATSQCRVAWRTKTQATPQGCHQYHKHRLCNSRSLAAAAKAAIHGR